MQNIEKLKDEQNHLFKNRIILGSVNKKKRKKPVKLF